MLLTNTPKRSTALEEFFQNYDTSEVEEETNLVTTMSHFEGPGRGFTLMFLR